VQRELPLTIAISTDLIRNVEAAIKAALIGNGRGR